MGQVFISFTATAKPEIADTTPVQMAASASVEGVAMPEAKNVISGLSAEGKLCGIAMPQPADTLNGAGKAAMALTMCGRPTSGALVYTRGQTGGELAVVGMPQPADTVEGAGATTASLKMLADPEAQGMTNILAAAKGESSGFMMPKMQGMAQIMAGAAGKLSMAAMAFVKTLFDVSFSVNGVTEHETQVLDGETVEDPVEAGIIEEPTRETTPQYIYDYAGWALSEDGEVLGSGSGETVILEETACGFVLDTNYGAYRYDDSPAPFTLVLGEIYNVLWDGVEYVCVAQDMSAMGEGFLGLGNLAAYGGTGNDEPFIIGWSAYGVTIFAFDTNTEHTVGISQITTAPILKNATFTSALDAEFGYVFPAAEDVELFEIGKQCTIVWDGKAYLCTAQDASAVMEGAHCLMGNGAAFGLDGNGEPFIIGLTTEGFILCLCLTDTAETEHTISIYYMEESTDNDHAMPAITADTVFYAVFNTTVRKYTANFYVNGVLESTQQVPYGEAAVPPELTGEAGMVLQWGSEDFTIYGDTNFHGIWTRDYIVSGEFTFPYDGNTGVYTASTTAKNPIVSGATYIVEWNGVEYTCTARDVKGSVANGALELNGHNVLGDMIHYGTFIGNVITWNGSTGNGEPFCIRASSSGNTTLYLSTLNDVGTITVNIYAKQ